MKHLQNVQNTMTPRSAVLPPVTAQRAPVDLPGVEAQVPCVF